VAYLDETAVEMWLFDWILEAILCRKHRERIWQAKWEQSIAAAAARIELEGNTAPCSDFPISTTPRSTPYPVKICRTPITREYINYDGLLTLEAEKKHKPTKEPELLYPLPPLGPMEGIGKNRRSVDVTDDYLSMLQRNTLDAQQPLISDHGRASCCNTDTSSHPAIQMAMQRGTKDESHPIVKMPSESAATVMDNSRPVLVATRRTAPGGSWEGGSDRGQEGCWTDALASCTGRCPPSMQGMEDKHEWHSDLETLVSGEELCVLGDPVKRQKEARRRWET